jgi:hypothetical protein
LSGDRLLLKVQVVNPKGAATEVLVCGEGPDTVRKDRDESTGVESVVEILKDPYSFAQAILCDSVTGSRLPIGRRQTGDPYPGELAVVITLRPDEAIEMGAIFDLSRKPQGIQILRLKLPGSKQVIENIPALSDVGINAINKDFKVKTAAEIAAETKATPASAR